LGFGLVDIGHAVLQEEAEKRRSSSSRKATKEILELNQPSMEKVSAWERESSWGRKIKEWERWLLNIVVK